MRRITKLLNPIAMKRLSLYMLCTLLLILTLVIGCEGGEAPTRDTSTDLTATPIRTLDDLIQCYEDRDISQIDIVTATGERLLNHTVTTMVFQGERNAFEPPILEVFLRSPEHEQYILFLSNGDKAPSPMSLSTGATFWKWPQADTYLDSTALNPFTPYIQLAQLGTSELGAMTTAIPIGEKVQLIFKKE